MPRLEWIGKEKVVNHAKEVPFHVLERKYSFGEGRDGMIIHGDNLLALKSLLPEYEGRVKCIYIEETATYGTVGEELPMLFAYYGEKQLDLSGLTAREQMLSVLEAELGVLSPDISVILLAVR